MSGAEFIFFRSLNTHQVLIIVVDTRILGCVADSLQQRSFASISPADYKDAKSSIFCSEVIWIKVAHYNARGKAKDCVGMLSWSPHVPYVPFLVAGSTRIPRTVKLVSEHRQSLYRFPMTPLRRSFFSESSPAGIETIPGVL
jgi:hypothetical protein